jgi:hypothetical protein
VTTSIKALGDGLPTEKLVLFLLLLIEDECSQPDHLDERGDHGDGRY